MASPAGAQTPAEWRAIGQYGEKSAPLTLFERDAVLFVDGAGHTAARLTRIDDGRYGIAGGGELVLAKRAVRLNGRTLPFRDFGAESEAATRSAVKADPVALRRRAQAATPPVQAGPFSPDDLVDLTGVDPRIRLDIRYAGTNNFMGIPLYERAAAFLQRPAAEALGRAQQALAARGYGLMIHDAYRPWFVTWMFWEATPPEVHAFVADPAKGSRHNRGSAVDLTLYDLGTGKVVEMPSRYDEWSSRSFANFIGNTTKQRALRDLLRETMVAEGFEVYPEEWWHFDHKDWRRYAIGTRSLTDLASGR
ncbi:D-alanyl-D-alanine dipeptidase [Sphingomonas zeicaulis]|uniref:M15 family metallopeptidase n=1 Tax=Sphingomonas zeicaulis TaxID=1632740 RepID=UPI003D229B1E